MFEEIETTVAHVGNGYSQEQALKKEEEEGPVINVVLRIDEDNIEERLEGLTGRQYRTANKDPESQFAFIARFMVDENGRYLAQDEAFEILDSLSVGQVLDVLQEVTKEIALAAAPKKSRKQSTTARISKYR